MNSKMLKCLVDLSAGEIDCIDVDSFFNQFPNNPATVKELKTLNQLGYISILNADDDIESIGVNKKALDYFK